MSKRTKYQKSVEIITQEYCSYGCGSIAKFKSPSGILMCCKSTNACPTNRKKNSEGCFRNYKETGRNQKEIYASLPESTKIKMNFNKDKFTADFSYDGKGSHKKLLIQENGHRCECCNLEVWMNFPITLELEHIDGNNRNNVRSNLKLLCPNCHSLTDTWRGRNKNSGKTKVTDKELIVALKEFKTIRQALLFVGLAAKGGNYDRCHQLISAGLVERQTHLV